jgi:hypothetical protein
MTPRSLFSTIIAFLAYLLLQVFFVREIVLFDYFFCFIYLACILLLPFETPVITLLLIGFGIGFFVDLFYNTLGMHAAATTLIAFLRPAIIKLLTPQRGYEDRMTLSLKSMGLRWFVLYIGIMAFIHHFVLFFLEAANWSLFIPTIGKVIASILFTTFILTVLQYFKRNV